MTAHMQVRETVILDLPLPEGIRVLFPEKTIVRFANGKTLDLGSLCYLRREEGLLSKGSRVGRKVDVTSFWPVRIQQIHALIEHMSVDLLHTGRRVETVRTNMKRFLVFMHWADENGWTGVLGSREIATAAIREYCSTVREKVTRNEISTNSGAAQQAVVITILGEFLGIEDLSRGLNLLRSLPQNAQSTKPPGQDSQGRILTLCEHIFSGLSKLVLDQAPYPYALSMPSYMKLRDNRLWIFPAVSWFQTPAMRASGEYARGARYNYEEGRIATPEEFSDVHAGASKLAKARMLLKASNVDPFHVRRRQAALTAINAYIVLFVAETGMNWAQVTELAWSDDFGIETSHQAFRTIKCRAAGKMVSFELPVAAMPNFKRFLALRNYLLKDAKCLTLFFRRTYPKPPLPIRTGLNTTYLMLKRFDATLKPITSRQWRAAKSDWLVRYVDPSTAALVLQNTEKTVLASYAEGSPTLHMEEMGEFFEQMGSVVLSPTTQVEGAVTRAVGSCNSYGTPVQLPGQVPVTPDCKRVEGCFFCDKFAVHADERDTRKLLSCRYCLHQTASLIPNEEERTALFNPLLEKIQLLLSEISKRSPDMVKKVTHEVDNEGELDPYWARKLEMLMELGVAS